MSNSSLPEAFEEKVSNLLKYLYDNGGKEYKQIELQSHRDYHLTNSSKEEEFNSVMDALYQKGFISWQKRIGTKGIGIVYFGVMVSEDGHQEIRKNLPNIPMFGLVEQTITTGNPVLDEKINHARKLFFNEPFTMDNKRSACETLCFVLEPLRDQLMPTFTSADVNAFFELVNRFDIRHNKESTKALQHEEQLEWVFYTLLNSINTYAKLKAKLGK